MVSATPRPPALPRALKPGDTLGIAAPASPFDRNSFEAGTQVLESMGFTLAFPETLFERSGYLAGSDQQRADQLNQLFADPRVDGIICARGGYGSTRILSLLDTDLIASRPKAFVGFSDITAVLCFLVQRCRLAAFHGPSVTTLGDGDATTREHFLAAVTAPGMLTVVARKPQIIQAGSARGTFFSGNLTVLCHLTGTGFQPDLNNHILLLEDRGEAPYRIDRMLTQMRQAGCFDGLAGVALGTFSECGPPDEIRSIVADRLGGLGIPILAGFDVGHAAVNLTLPVGVPVSLDTASHTLAFRSSASG